LLVIIWVAELFYGQQAVEGKLFGEIAALLGKESAKQIEDAIWLTRLSGEANIAAVAGITTLVLGATGVLAEIQDSINQIWHIRPRPRKGKGWVRLIKNRFISFSMIAVFAFLLLVSLMINTVVDLLGQRLAVIFSNQTVVLLYIINLIFSFLLTAFLFAVIFKMLPDGKVKWRQVIPGVIITTLLFMLGKFLLGFYISSKGASSPYGAAGSVVIILLWVYYSAIILYAGAVLTRLWILYKGEKIYPKKYAVWVERVEVPASGNSAAAP
ncbi:MAG TPA: YihY/virulence factor BrkB family protein, partial [Chitinophagaceae bacterium]